MRNRDKRKARRMKEQARTLHLSPREARLPRSWQPPVERAGDRIERQIMGGER